MRYAFIFLLSLLFLFAPSFLKADPIDSLKTALEFSDNDYQRIDILNKLAEITLEKKREEALPFYRSAIALAHKIGSDSLLGKNLLNLGTLYANIGNIDSTELNLKKALSLFSKNKDSLGIAHVYRRIGYLEKTHKSNNVSAVDYLLKAINIYERSGNERFALNCYNTIAETFSIQGNFEDSNKWATKTINYLKDEEVGIIHSIKLKFNATNVIAMNYVRQENDKEALPYFDEAIRLSEKLNSPFRIAISLAGKSTALRYLGEYENSLRNLKRAMKIAEENNYQHLLPQFRHDLASIYFEKKDFEKALKYYLPAVELMEAQNQAFNLSQMYLAVSETYEGLNKNKEALLYYKKYYFIKDSIFNEGKEKIINELNTKYETTQKEKEIALLSEKEKTQTAEITAGRNRNFLLLGLLGMLLFGGGAFYYRRQLNEQLHLQSIRTQISSDLHDEVGSSLAQLSMIMGSVEGSDPAAAKSYLQKGNEVLMSSISKIRDVVWAIDAGNDSTGSLLDRMEDFAYDMLSPKDVKYKISNEGFDRKANLPPLIRQNFYLFYKEAITNISKHSNADEVKIDFSKTSAPGRKGKNLSLKIADNGKDLNDKKVSGSGLSNMKLRANKIGGTFDFEKTEEGFKVYLNALIN